MNIKSSYIKDIIKERPDLFSIINVDGVKVFTINNINGSFDKTDYNTFLINEACYLNGFYFLRCISNNYTNSLFNDIYHKIIYSEKDGKLVYYYKTLFFGEYSIKKEFLKIRKEKLKQLF